MQNSRLEGQTITGLQIIEGHDVEVFRFARNIRGRAIESVGFFYKVTQANFNWLVDFAPAMRAPNKTDRAGLWASWVHWDP